MSRLLQRFCDDERNGLTLMIDAVVLQDVEALAHIRIDDALVRPVRELRRIVVCDDGDDARRTFRRRTVDTDRPVGARAADDHTVGNVCLFELGSVGRLSGDLLAAIDTADGSPDILSAHVRAPAVATARTIARCISSILKSLCPYPLAPCVACEAARCKDFGSMRAPRKAASTRGTRHGFVPTPPRAIRASRIRSPSMSTAAAQETNANSNDARSRTLT